MTELTRKYVSLDLVRGLAALAVVAGHAKAFFLQGFNSEINWFWKGFNFITDQGRSAVMVFFVLSGYLVGRNVYQAFNADRWSWKQYAIKRLSRLWIVLIPALVLTALWDQIGIHVYHGALYSGLLSGGLYGHSLPGPSDVGVIYKFGTFLGNSLFLQTILVPTFGTNGPLWSLANEFWYYVIFPLGFLATRRRAPCIWRVLSAGFALILCFLLPRELVLYGIIWLFGFCVVLVEVHAFIPISPTVTRALTVVLFGIFLSTIYGPRFLEADEWIYDFIHGISFSALLPFLLKIDIDNRLLSRVSKILAECSYTLYLTHFPFLALLSSVFLGNAKLQLSVTSLAAYIGLISLAVLYALCVYFFFERHTKKVQTIFSFAK